jgi:Ni,Fe-hydrogenase maturation factor
MRDADEGGGVTLEFRYQLNVEDAYTIRDFDLVIFADAAGISADGAAAADAPEDVALTGIVPSATIAFTTHELSPASVLALCHELYGRAPRAFTLAIRGYEWDLGEELSAGGRANLVRAAKILHRFLEEQ